MIFSPGKTVSLCFHLAGILDDDGGDEEEEEEAVHTSVLEFSQFHSHLQNF